MDRMAAKQMRTRNPDARDRYLNDCREKSEFLFTSLEMNKDKLSEYDYLSVAETAEYLEQQSIGIEGIDF